MPPATTSTSAFRASPAAAMCATWSSVALSSTYSSTGRPSRPPRALMPSVTILARLTLAMPMKESAPVWSVIRPTRAGRLIRLVIVALAYAGYWPSSDAVRGLPRCPASFRIGGTSGSDTKFAHPSSFHSNSTHTRFSSVGSRNTAEPFDPCRARLSAPLLPNTSRNRSTSSTVVVARIMMISFARIAADLGERRPVGRRIATLRETPWQQHRQNYPFRRWAGAGPARPYAAHGGCERGTRRARAAQLDDGYLRVRAQPRFDRTVDRMTGRCDAQFEGPGRCASGSGRISQARLCRYGRGDRS